jgi:ketosteroid isomerase-like protein
MAGAQQSPMIETLNRQFAEALKTRDFAAVAGMFTDEAVMMPPRRNIITGRNKIQSYWTRAARIREIKFDTDSVTTLGSDVIREIGTLHIRIEPRGATSQDKGGEDAAAGLTEAAGSGSRDVLGKYLFLWRKIDGEWKLETSIWNRNRPQTGGRRPRRRRARE